MILNLVNTEAIYLGIMQKIKYVIVNVYVKYLIKQTQNK